MTPSISIVVPAFHAAKYIGETLESIRQQSCDSWELVVVEDGSNDGTEQIVRDFSNSVAQKVTFARHDQNKGLPSTRNTAIGLAAGQWIALLDSDDLWHTEHLQHLLDTAATEKADFVYSGSLLFEDSIENVTEERAPSEECLARHPLSLYLAEYAIQPSSTLISKKLLQDTGGFDPTIKYCEDRDMWLTLIKAGATFAFAGASTCFYRKHANAMTKKSATMAYYNAVVFQKHLDFPFANASQKRKETASAWLSAARLARRADPQHAIKCLRKSLALRPSPRAALLLLALSATWRDIQS